MKYDADEPPDAAAWLAASELERIDAAREYCARHEADLPEVELHAMIHAAVEAQIALGDETPVAAVQRRLLAEGLSRHETIHAIGAVLADHLFNLVHAEAEGSGANEAYHAALESLTAASWRAMAEEPPRPRKRKKGPRWRPKRRRK
ncbi:MAG: hypothetical protein D6739_02530 [Nitrospirae bacterium]|nr:MAG: hypothetical protein D6739_02530 [Nitrospirota bacterium]